MHLWWLQDKITALNKNLLNSNRISQLTCTRLLKCAENSHYQHESYTKTHTHPWGTSRAAAFLCFLSAHRLFTKATHKTKKHFLWILWWVPKGLTLGILAHAQQAHVTRIYLWLSCQGTYWYHMQIPSWGQGNSKLLLQQDWKDHKFSHVRGSWESSPGCK